jgi:HK97 family phage portal protein
LSRLVVFRPLEVQRAPTSLWSRVRDSLRSLHLGPWSSSDKELARRFGGGATDAGVVVNEFTALNYSAVWAAVQAIAPKVAQAPLILYKRLPNGGKERFTQSNLYRILRDEWNPEMTSMVARETLTAHMLTWGNGYAEIERDQAGRAMALWPLLPNQVEPFRDQAKRLMYRVSAPGEPDAIIPAGDMLHVPGLGFDGLVGYSVVRMARDSFALGMAAQRFGATFFGNGATFGGALTHPGELGQEGRDNLRASIESEHKGASRAHRFLILEEGMKYEKFGVDPNDAQFLETRQFEITEVARWFDLPPHKLRDLSRATFSNIEQQAIEFVVDTLMKWFIRWEQEINRKLISKLERNIQFVEHLVDGMLRGDIGTRYSAYATGRQWGWLSANDVRDKENMNPLPGEDGNIYLVPSNMTTPERILNPPAPQLTPLPRVPADDENDDEEDERYVQLLTEIREAQQRLDLLRETLATKAAHLEGLDVRLVEASQAHQATLDQLTTAQGDLRAQLEIERDAHAKALSALAETRAEGVSRADAWSHERVELERQMAAKQAELEALVTARALEHERQLREEEQRQAAHAEDVARVQSAADEAMMAARAQAEREADALARSRSEEAVAAARVEVEIEAARQAEIHAAELARVRQEEAEAARALVDAAQAEACEREAQAVAEAVSVAAAEASAREREAAAAFVIATAAEHTAKVQAIVRDHETVRAQIEDEARQREAATRAETEAAVSLLQGQLNEALAAKTAQEGAESARREAVESEQREQREADETRAVEMANLARLAQEAEVRAQTAVRERDEAERLRQVVEAEKLEAKRLAAEEAEARASAVAALEARRVSEGDRLMAVLGAHRALVVEAAGRLIREEVDKARRHQATPSKFRQWLDTFYVTHEQTCIDRLLPIVRVHLAWMMSDDDPLSVAREHATAHVAESQRLLRAIANGDQADFAKLLARVLDRWEQDRPEAFADLVLREEIDYVRRHR